ncbi:HAEPLYID family protein [Algoriphagus mannitolivorans]|uniref:HAEPLYID family protein n=1 Tax=Algoriphagus mannitolivorans TaxID=226504 RepID=UPI0003FC10E5|nr:HAEPLYID family protein [Algoriphagus mannitolivorans]
MKKITILALLGLQAFVAMGQTQSDSLKYQRSILDSLFIEEFESQESHQKPKVLHAEPLYIDLIRDLGARKGEKEWNVGFGMQDKRSFDEFHALVEYEWAPLDRLGLEVELPVSLYSFRQGSVSEKIPENKLESLKLASQYTFLVSEKNNLSMALGYIHQFELDGWKKLNSQNVFTGNIYNPFLVAAKRLGSNYHTLIYTGPRIHKEFGQKPELTYEINWNFHYMVSGTRNFIGMEINQEIHQGKSIATLRPQMRLGLAENLMIGIVSAIPIQQPDYGLGSFIRIIYEPGFRAMH